MISTILILALVIGGVIFAYWGIQHTLNAKDSPKSTITPKKTRKKY